MSAYSCEPFYIEFRKAGGVESVWKTDRRYRKGYRVLYDATKGIEVPGWRDEVRPLIGDTEPTDE